MLTNFPNKSRRRCIGKDNRNYEDGRMSPGSAPPAPTLTCPPQDGGGKL